jgi:hypothetical protein
MIQKSINHAHPEMPKASQKRWIRSTLLLCGAFVLAFSQLLPFQASAEPDVDPDSSVFGVHVYDYTDQEGVIQLRQTDTAWVRGFELVWSDLEPNSAADAWTLPADLVSQIEVARADGFEPILTVRSTPIWAQKYTEPEYFFCGPIMETEFDDFANFLVEALDQFPLTAEIKYLEVWNEADVAWEDVAGDRIWGGCWGEKTDLDFYGGDYYAAMLQVVYPVVKAAYPNVQILLGGLQMECDPDMVGATCTSTRFFDGILEGGGGAYFDGISFHAYDYYGGEPGTYANTSWNSAYDTTGPVVTAKLGYLRARLQEYGVTGKYFLNTENSLLFDEWVGDADFEETKAGYLVKSYATSISLGLKANLWYELVGHWAKGVGLLELVSLDPFPAYDAYQFASQTLNNVEPLGEVTINPLMTGYAFRKATGLVWVVWSTDGSAQTVDVDVEPVAVYDIYGIAISNPTNLISLSYQPVYIELVDALNRVYVPVVPYYFRPFTNGDFEDGAAGWDFVNAGLPAGIIREPAFNPITGLDDPYIPDETNTAILGNPDYPCSSTGVPLGYAAVEQIITVPEGPGVGQVELTFDYIIYTQDANPVVGGIAYDQFAVYVATGNNLLMLFEDNNRVNTNLGCSNWRRVPGIENVRDGEIDGWATGSVDLTDYAGMTITLSFRNYSRFDNWYNTYTYLDNVQLVVTP